MKQVTLYCERGIKQMFGLILGVLIIVIASASHK